jgi:hypothetical protein
LIWNRLTLCPFTVAATPPVAPPGCKTAMYTVPLDASPVTADEAPGGVCRLTVNVPLIEVVPLVSPTQPPISRKPDGGNSAEMFEEPAPIDVIDDVAEIVAAVDPVRLCEAAAAAAACSSWFAFAIVFQGEAFVPAPVESFPLWLKYQVFVTAAGNAA